MALPNEKDPQWAELVKKYLASTRGERNELAKGFGFKSRNNFQTGMARRGIYLPASSHNPNPEYQPGAPLPEPEPIILPIPKIELRSPPVQEEREKDEDQVLLLSDTQFGLKTKSFGKNVAIKRMLRLYTATCRFADIQRKFCPVNKLNIFLIGDICHGELIGKQVMLDELELTLDEQKWLAYSELSNFFINACQWYSEIKVTCVTGNHGILGKYFSYASNWNIVVYDMLKVGLTNYPQIEINVIRDDFYAIQKIQNIRFLILHGDKIPMYLSLPFYGIDRRSLRWNQSLPPWDVLTMGHFHSLSYIQPSGIPIMINGTLSSDSRYVAQWVGVKEIAEMWTFFVGEKCITGWHRIDLQREEG